MKFFILNSLKSAHSSLCVAGDAAEQHIKKLPCLLYSPSAFSQTHKVYSYTDLELACQILCMCPVKWQDQYHLLEKCYPKEVKPLLAIFECIEVEVLVD